jgi:hypothetical protein
MLQGGKGLLETLNSRFVMPIGGNATFRVLCHNHRLLLSAEANPQFGYELTMDSLLVP